MTLLNRLLNPVFDLALRPLRPLGIVPSLAVVSLVTAVAILLVVRAVSDQQALAAVKRQGLQIDDASDSEILRFGIDGRGLCGIAILPYGQCPQAFPIQRRHPDVRKSFPQRAFDGERISWRVVRQSRRRRERGQFLRATPEQPDTPAYIDPSSVTRPVPHAAIDMDLRFLVTHAAKIPAENMIAADDDLPGLPAGNC